MGGMPDISAKMQHVGQQNNYESQGMERAVIIGQDGRPIGKIEDIPPFDLLTEENKHIIEQRRRQKEAQRKKQLDAKTNQNKPKVEVNSTDILESAKKNIIGRCYKYITVQKFGTVVEVVDCRLNNDEIQIVMDDGHTILLADIESEFIADIKIDDFIEDEPKIEIPTKKVETIQTKAISYSSNLPNSPLRDLLASRKKNPNIISIDLQIDLVKKDFFGIIDDSYDNAIDYVIEHVMNNLTLKDVKESIKKKLSLYYKSEENSIINQEFENKEIYKEPEMIILEKSQ
jgi:ribosomal protein L9